MIIADILKNHITPFEVDDEKLRKLFSFFLHSAPSIESATAAHIPPDRLMRNWNTYICGLPQGCHGFISSNCIFDKYLGQYNLDNNAMVNRKTKGFICKKKTNNEEEYECLLRHIRNSIAHSNVYMINAGNRKYLLFEDFNQSKNQSARILISQTDLQKLKSEIMK